MGRKTILIIVAFVIATVGALLVFMYVKGVDDRAVAQQQPRQVLTATSPIAAGESVEEAMQAGKFQLEAVPVATILPGALDSTDPIEAMVATSAIYPGEQIIAAKFGEPGSDTTLGIPDNRLAISVDLTDPSLVAGFVSPGSKIVLFLTSGDGEEAKIKLLLEDVTVLATGQATLASVSSTDDEGEQASSAVPSTILTLAVTQEEAQTIRLAERVGVLSLALRTDESEIAGTSAMTANSLFQ